MFELISKENVSHLFTTQASKIIEQDEKSMRGVKEKLLKEILKSYIKKVS